MGMATTELTTSWQLIVSTGTSFTLQVQSQGPEGGKALIAFKSSAPSANIGFTLLDNQGLTHEFGNAAENCYAKRVENYGSVRVVVAS